MIEMNKEYRILIIAYYFPPDSSSGALRPLFFANHLKKLGAKVTVMTADEDDFLPGQPKDYKLLAKLSDDIDVVRTKVWRPREKLLALRRKKEKSKNEQSERYSGLDEQKSKSSFFYKMSQSIKNTITDILASPDPQVGWIPGVIRQGRIIVDQKKIDVILATGSPWSGLIAGKLLSKLTKIPVILDFRDPWVANPGFVQRGKVAAFIERKMEMMVLTQTNLIIANTEELRVNFLRRFSFLEDERVECLPNGFEEYFVQDIPENSCFTLTHAGALYFLRNPGPLLQALHQLLVEKSIPVEKIKVVLLGEIALADHRIVELLQEPEMLRVVKILPRIPYDEALQYQLRSDVLILIQPGFPLQVPRKLYEYMSMRRPVLALTEEKGATGRIVSDYNLGVIAPNKVNSVKEAVLALYNQWLETQGGRQYNVKTDEFLNSNLVERLHGIIQKTVERGST